MHMRDLLTAMKNEGALNYTTATKVMNYWLAMNNVNENG